MKVNDKICGFKIESERELCEVSGKMYLATHEKSGAKLAFLSRPDKNKTFSIAFRTIPEDDTGVFHILEHSVLCGSEKYPVKEPFVELLKGSLNTFLNALTYQDRTVYPISSRNDKDFYNLISVYLDAVLYPLAAKNPNIFRQEGWHYEYDENNDTLTRNGVVFNEMKGAYSSPDEVSGMALYRALFPDALYKYDSGGAPEAIPSLTYEDFVNAHARYYHPANSLIFLDGDIDAEKTLGLIDSYLSKFDKIDIKADIPTQPAVDGGTVTVKYETAAADGAKARLLLGYVFSDYANKLDSSAFSVLSSALVGTNEAPIKKAILDTGLCEDMSVGISTSKQGVISVEFKNAREEDLEVLEATFTDAVRKIANEGIDRELLTATLNTIEFKMRERDYGSFPKGVAFALSAYGSWLYGGDPADHILTEDTLKALRERLDGDYYERLLLSATVDCPHRARVIMLPDATLGEENARREREELLAIRKAMSDEEIERIKSEEAALKAWQATVDSKENLDTLPYLTLDDLTYDCDTREAQISRVCDREVIHADEDTSGITYLKLMFDTSDLTPEEHFLSGLLDALLMNLKTERRSALALQSAIKTNLGSLSVSTTASTKNGRTTPALAITASVLDSKKAALIDIVGEVALTTLFDDGALIKNIILQTKAAMEEAIAANGLDFALGRVAASISAEGVLKEYTGGYEAYLGYKSLAASFDERAEDIKASLAALARKIFTRDRLSVAYTGIRDENFEKSLIDIFPSDGVCPGVCEIKPLGKTSEGIAAPSRVGYAVLGGDGGSGAAELLGALRVARSILSYEYLWNVIRVMGGAYGTGFVTRKSGQILFYSYRDPSPEASLEKYREAGNFLRGLAEEKAPLTKFIIGAMGEYDILTTPRTRGEQAVWDYLNGWTKEDDTALREGMVKTDHDTLVRLADLIDSLCDSASVAVVAGKEQLAEFKSPLEKILTI